MNKITPGTLYAKLSVDLGPEKWWVLHKNPLYQSPL